MNEPIYSIIIPHKNCPSLLNRCLDSIPKRDDIQIIIVDDNSDLEKRPIVDRKDAEVYSLDRHNSKGAGHARNVGMEKAIGKWLLFADADDCYTYYLPKLLDKYVDDNQTDIVYFNAYQFDDNDTIIPLKVEQLINNYIKRKKRSEEELRFGVWTSWTRMIKREVVVNNSILFEEVPSGNDIMFGLKASLYSNKIGVEKEYVYKYYKWPHGSITDKIREDMVDELFMSRGRLMVFYSKVGYRNEYNMFSIIERLVRARKISLKQAFVKYRKYLKEYDLCWAKDLICYFYVLLFVRARKRIMIY